MFARTVVDLARSLEAEEHRIKQSLLGAIQAGRLEEACAILTRWINGPIAEVLPGARDDKQHETRHVRHGRRRESPGRAEA